jgi:TolB-like protein/AraC-like DNA-binding protein/Flp pilus assembly protein TadD
MSISEQLILKKLSQLIEDNLSNPAFSLDDVYKESGVSRSHLHRIIKEQTQLSTTLFIRKIRLKKAQELLTTTHLRIAEIAEVIGIENPQNFSKYFVHEFNISPTEFRKQKNGKVPENNAITTTQTTPVPPKSRRYPSNYQYLWSGFILLILAIAAGSYYWKNTPAHPSKDADYSPSFDNSIAILPFKSWGSNQTVAEGVMEEIHSSLSLLENLKVIAKNSSNQYNNTDKTNWQIGDELGVAYLLKGRVREIDTRVQIDLVLVRTKDDIEVWSKKQEGELRNIFNLMNDIVKEVAVELQQKITPALWQRLERIQTGNLEAYNLFLQGRAMMMTRTKEKLTESIVKFDQALALDPDFAEAAANKAVAIHLIGTMGYADQKTYLNKAEQNALMAIQLDTQNGTAYAILGNIYREQFKWQQSETSYRIALKYKPNDAQTIYWYSLLLRSTGKLAESVKYSAKAMALDPLHPVILAGHICNCAYAGRFDLAKKTINDGKLLFNTSFPYYMGIGYYQLCRNEYKLALKNFKKVEELNPNMKYFKTLIVYSEAKSGNTSPAALYLKTPDNDPQAYISKSMVYAGLNQPDSSMLYLQKAADLGTIHSDLMVNPIFRIHHKDPRFKAILTRFGLSDSFENVQ